MVADRGDNLTTDPDNGAAFPYHHDKGLGEAAKPMIHLQIW
jgi:hypothetical protein